MPYANTPSGRLFFVHRSSRTAAGPTVLFVHGAGGHALLWGAVMNHLPGIHCEAVDLPGHGRSPGSGHLSIDGYSAVILELADALNLQDIVVAGHSMGGAIALSLALLAPSRIRALVLVSTAARLAVAPTLLQQMAEDPAAAVQWIIENGYGPGVSERMLHLSREQLAQVPPSALHSDYVACSTFDVRDRLAEIGCPALLLCGSVDRLTPPQQMRAIQKAMPAARFELVPGAGHMLPMEQPEALAKAIAAFLESL